MNSFIIFHISIFKDILVFYIILKTCVLQIYLQQKEADGNGCG